MGAVWAWREVDVSLEGCVWVTSGNEPILGGQERHLGIVLLLECLRLSWMVRWVR